MFQAIGHCAKGESLDSRKRGSLRLPIGHYARQRRYFAEPSPVFFLFQLYFKLSDFRHKRLLIGSIASRLSLGRRKIKLS